jgi:hypothetical protein
LSLASGCLDVIRLRPEFRPAAINHDALELSDALETLIDQQKETPNDREAAYDAVRNWKQRSASYAYARAKLAGRLAEMEGLLAIGLIGEMEKYSRISVALDPRFRDGAARRMLGTLYVLAPPSMMKYGDSEEGLELLEKQLERYPKDTQNHVRVAEGYIALNDEEGAYGPLCFAIEHAEKLRPSEKRLMDTLIKQVGGVESLGCDE